MLNLPNEFVRRMNLQLGDQMNDYIQSLTQPAVRGIRMNPMKPFDGMGLYTCGEKIPWEKNGFIIDPDSQAGSTIYHEAGAFYLQEPSAMLPVRALQAKPGETILDLCAAPGGKSTQIGIDMQGEGLLICNEPVAKRAQVLSRNIERIGITNSVVINCAPEDIAEKWAEKFDKVLVDAPCSGEGMFRRHPETRGEWSRANADGCVKRQKDILIAAQKMLSPGGILVYSTCTFNPDENQKMIDWFLAKYRHFELESFDANGIKAENGMVLCYPHCICGEGQFVAKLRKNGVKGSGETMKCQFPRPDRKAEKLWKDLFPDAPEANGMIGNTMIVQKECPDLKGIKVMRAGLHLAEIRGKMIYPNHAAALSVKRIKAPITDIGDKAALQYISGEEISGETKGWTLVQFRNLILGWGKGSNGIIKNHYPKALRNQRIII